MNGRQRILAALARQPVDRPPVFPRDLTLGMDMLDADTREVCAGGPGGTYNGPLSAECVLSLWRYLGQDALVGSIHDLGLDTEALGGVVDFPAKGVPFVRKPAFADRSCLRSAEIPRMDRDGRLPGYLEAFKRVRETVGENAALAANVEGPLTKAAILRGTQALMTDLISDPEYAYQLLDFATGVSILHMEHLARAGADFVFLASAADNPGIVGPKLFQSFTLPYLARLVDTAHALDLPVVFHPHGDFTSERFAPLVDECIAASIEGLQFSEECDLYTAKQRWGDQLTILGNVDILTILKPGPPQRVRSAAKACIQAAGPDGFVLMASCSLHRGENPRHVKAMINAASESLV
ncbi:putative Uroporphyrinogen decarboxylase [Desulfosarcina cetonica]|uniref:uroporphyrinogen decarboxylase family protein n=1 Tax=Desulfosarcina cetonica TaxID=90730 RepID=UPI0006CFF9AA|nr:uroporphyrinogen decarboxylase family protein [Desulfosarcina cetonica]VTR70471.1 putative Uroporphyrinogen decarboxylase [Desulfosarcina cetonica]